MIFKLLRGYRTICQNFFQIVESNTWAVESLRGPSGVIYGNWPQGGFGDAAPKKIFGHHAL